ncbi:sulfotransferase [Peristeroidobacter agariperforans]|uniref:sulfotransferase n=1 Tax=Peristeroidobacter agariperforans TaxID=268404 RepID=UPI00101DE53A|nr:sulfotransferase [Peristeroidobacter agariperforans]
MRLPKPFYRLPLRFDVERLRAEVAALPAEAWARHPNDIKGNSAARLISVDGGENDDVNGRMQATAHLQQSPYIRQILASFGVVWSRSRLLRLAPGATVPEHADINYHWFTRVRLHIPIVTRPEVRFYCSDQVVHMAAGEAWLFDNWRSHRVENFTPDERIHLVADTSGSAHFWQLVAQSDNPAAQVRTVSYVADRQASPLMERAKLAPVMTPGEIDFLILDLRSELVARENLPNSHARLVRYHAMLEALCKDWRQLYALYGGDPQGWPEFTNLRDGIRNASRELSEGLVMRTNGVGVHQVLEGRVLRAMLSLPQQAASTAAPARPTRARAPTIEAPIFIVSAPRSGSTLLFETLAASSQLCTVGGEAHWLVEGIEGLRPGAPGIDSNRLSAEHATDAIAEDIRQEILSHLRDHTGQPLSEPGQRRFLEKTPKNSLRIPFFNRIFPDARFVFLWRDPRENISSIMEAWRSGQWRTYPKLEGFDGPWSMLLPPGWRDMNGRPLAEIAAWQWERTNAQILDDLQPLGPERWAVVQYANLLRDPAGTIGKLCEFLHLPVDSALADRLSAPLPSSRYTLTAPAADKWRTNEAQIAPVLPSVQVTWDKLIALR